MKKALNEKMYKASDCEDIKEEIKNEYPGGSYLASGLKVWFANDVKRFEDSLNKELINVDYISHAVPIRDKKSGCHIIQKDSRFGVYSGVKNKIICPPDYLQIIFLEDDNGKEVHIMAMNENFKWGIINEKRFINNKIELVPFEYDDIDTPVEGVFPVKSNNKWGLFDTYHKELRLSVEYEEIDKPSNRFYPVKSNGKWGLYHEGWNEMVIDAQYDEKGRLCEGVWTVKKDGKWGAVDIFNRVIIPFEYEWISDFTQGYAHASKYPLTEDDENIGLDTELLIDHQGGIVYFSNLQYYDDSYRKNLVVKRTHINYEEFYYVVDKNGDTIIPQNKYRYLGPYCEGLFAASIDGDKMGFIDIAENIIIPFDYHFNKNSIFFADYSFHWGVAGVGPKTKWNYRRETILIDHSGFQIFPYSLQCSYLKFEKGVFKTDMSGIWGLFKRNSILLTDLIRSYKGYDMSYLIKTEEEIEEDRKREELMREQERGYEWTAEDTWDAMTDGMYGDYPGSDVDYEKIGF